jgi:adenine deaminase
MKRISGKIVDVVNQRIYNGVIEVEQGVIVNIVSTDDVEQQYIVPGLVDAHIHIESSMMLPSEFARYSLPCGTVACVCDPHEIANVCGIEGVEYMIENASHVPMKFVFGAPSCVPATPFETAGACLDAERVKELLHHPEVNFLAEMMNFPGVIYGDADVMAKLSAAKALNKPIDGHAPGLTGDDLSAYAMGGITTDHECMTLDEAYAKIALGIKVIIREGSAAKNFDTLLPLMNTHPEMVMFCSDDKHPDDLMKNGHIDSLVRRAVAADYNVMTVLRACSYTPVKHYNLNVGLLQKGDKADLLIVDNLTDFTIQATYLDGVMVARQGKPTFERHIPFRLINNFNAQPITAQQLVVKPHGNTLKVIVVEDGQLYTKMGHAVPLIEHDNVVSDPSNDLLKLVVYNRYVSAPPAVAFIKNIGLKRGALASTVAHDSHNIVAVGCDDEHISLAINELIKYGGGIAAIDSSTCEVLPLPVGGLMSERDGNQIAHQYEVIDHKAKQLGSKLTAPFMTLAFMSLLVIPELKLGDKGLFDGLKFEFVPLME